MSTRALQFDILLTPVIDYRDGSIASGYTVYFYAAGTSTAKNVWTEKEKTNPYTSRTLGSSGTVQVYGDGIYKIIIQDLDGTDVYEWDNIKVQSPNIAVLSKSGTYTATVDDDYILVGATMTLNLYAAASFTHPLCVKLTGSYTLTIDPSGAELIEGASTYTLSTANSAVWLFSNGSAWYVANAASVSATDAINLVASIGGDAKLTAKSTTIDIETNNEYLRQLNAAGDDYVDIIKVNASNQIEIGAVIELIQLLNTGLKIKDTDGSHYLTVKPGSNLSADRILTLTTGDASRTITMDQNLDLSTTAYPRWKGLNDGTYNIAIPTNGMAAAKFMLGNSNTIVWFYLNTAPPGWKVLSTGADTVLGVAGGTAAYNANGGTAGGTWIQPDHKHQWYEFNAANPHQSYDTNGDLQALTVNSDAYMGIQADDSGTNTILSQDFWTNLNASVATWRPSASIGKLFQLDTA